VGKASYDRALEDTTKVLELEPGNKDVYWVRGEIYLNLANFSLDKKNAKEAEDYANKAIADLQIAPETNPKSREIALRLGDARLAKGDLEGALADYAKMLEKDPHDWDKVIIPHLDRLFETCDKLGRDCDCGSYKDTWYLAGKFQDRKKHFDRAIKCYFKAIELGLTDSSVYWSRAVDYNFIGEWDKALSDANTIIKLDPSSYAYKFRADIYQRKGALDKAIDDYHKADKALRGEIKKTEYSEEAAQAVDKEAYEIHLGAAEAYLKKQNWSKAIDEYQAAIEFTVNPGLRRAFVLYRIGMAYQSKGDTKNAQKYFHQAEAMDPNVKK
jgi:tetratricopeptide (TPR) repeat protein